MQRIAGPVLVAGSQQRLHAEMPVEAQNVADRTKFTHLEAIGRLLAGLAPWLEVPQLDPAEELLRQRHAELARQALEAATDPSSPDYCNFNQDFQPIVDAAFLALALLRAPVELWEKLTTSVQQHIIVALKLTRSRKPFASNWLLFSALIETALYRLGEPDWDPMRIDYALKQHEQWYLGDGLYSDGVRYHMDYYNSFVIHPMLLEIISSIGHEYPDWQQLRASILARAQRYAAILERSISPEGTFPVHGRSLAYRLGNFHLLADLAQREQLPAELEPAQVRCALTAVMHRMLEMPDTFDTHGWLTIGFCGHQPEIGEQYISTGSLYLCATVFLPLGLPCNRTFWQGKAAWTAQKAWGGQTMIIDHALDA
jgi:hypothetical protein